MVSFPVEYKLTCATSTTFKAARALANKHFKARKYYKTNHQKTSYLSGFLGEFKCLIEADFSVEELKEFVKQTYELAESKQKTLDISVFRCMFDPAHGIEGNINPVLKYLQKDFVFK